MTHDSLAIERTLQSGWLLDPIKRPPRTSETLSQSVTRACECRSTLRYTDVIHTVFRLGSDDIHSRDGVGVVRGAVRHVSL